MNEKPSFLAMSKKHRKNHDRKPKPDPRSVGPTPAKTAQNPPSVPPGPFASVASSKATIELGNVPSGQPRPSWVGGTSYSERPLLLPVVGLVKSVAVSVAPAIDFTTRSWKPLVPAQAVYGKGKWKTKGKGKESRGEADNAVLGPEAFSISLRVVVVTESGRLSLHFYTPTSLYRRDPIPNQSGWVEERYSLSPHHGWFRLVGEPVQRLESKQAKVCRLVPTVGQGDLVLVQGRLVHESVKPYVTYMTLSHVTRLEVLA